MVQFDNFLEQKTWWFFSVLHSSESDANSSRSTKYVSKLVKDFLDNPLQKNNDSEVVGSPPHEDFLVGYLNTPIPLSAGAESLLH